MPGWQAASMPHVTIARGRDRDVGPLVLEYHAVSESWDADLAVTPSQFRRQLELLVRRGYRGATFTDAVTGGSSRDLVVTFDDAYLSVLEVAHPILESFGLPATVFVVTDFAGDGRPLEWERSKVWRGPAFEGELRGMTWSQLAGLAGSGWEIGSHTRTHPHLTRLADDQLNEELRGSREAIEQALGRPCTSLAYPFGDVDARVAAAASEAGYLTAAIEDVRRRNLFMWPRVGIYRADSPTRFRLKVSPTLRWLRANVRLREGTPV